MNRVFIKTYGCQMNERDSEAVAAMLRARGYRIVADEDNEDVLRLNLCGVRDAAGHHLTAPAATPAIVGGGQHWAMVRNLTLYLVKLASPPVPILTTEYLCCHSKECCCARVPCSARFCS